MALCVCVCVFICTFLCILVGFFQNFLCAGLWMGFLSAEIKKLKIVESVYNYEKQDTTWNRKLKSIQQH